MAQSRFQPPGPLGFGGAPLGNMFGVIEFVSIVSSMNMGQIPVQKRNNNRIAIDTRRCRSVRGAARFQRLIEITTTCAGRFNRRKRKKG